MTKINKKAVVKVAEVLKAVAHPVRLRIIELLEHDGTKVYYRIANPNVIRLLHCVYDNCENE